MLQKISYNLGIATLSRGVIGVLSLVVVGILTRSLGPVGFGQYSAIFAYLYIFTAIADLGLYTVMVREISRTVERDEERQIAGKIFTMRLIAVALMIGLADLLVFAFPYPLTVKIGILIASLFSISSSLAQVLVGVFQKYLRLYFVSASDILARLVQLALLIILAKFGAGLLWFVAVVVISEAVHFAFIFGFSRRMVKIKTMVDWTYFRQTFKTALPIAVSLVLVLIYFKLDTVLLSIMKPAEDVGIYSVAYKALEAVIFLPAIYVGLVMPILSKYAIASKTEFIKTFRKTFDTLSIFALPFAAYLFVLSDDLAKLIGGGEFAASGPVLKILSLAIFLIFFGNLGGNAIIALNLQKKGMWIYLSGAILNVSANLILIPRYSYFATAWTTVATELLITVWMFAMIKKELGVMPKFQVFGKAVIAMTLMVLVILPFSTNLWKASLLSLIYYPLLFALGGFTKADFRELISLKKSPKLSEEL